MNIALLIVMLAPVLFSLFLLHRFRNNRYRSLIGLACCAACAYYYLVSPRASAEAALRVLFEPSALLSIGLGTLLLLAREVGVAAACRIFRCALLLPAASNCAPALQHAARRAPWMAIALSVLFAGFTLYDAMTPLEDLEEFALYITHGIAIINAGLVWAFVLAGVTSDPDTRVLLKP